ncbi:hypothetical protein PA25_34580 [Pseudoalteromonas sp. A25]|nr:hypothetical protein PA25_34580 [Pseudoalteromonas sp. A25]
MHQQVLLNSERFLLLGEIIFSLQKERGFTSVFSHFGGSSSRQHLSTYQNDTQLQFNELIHTLNEANNGTNGTNGNTVDILNGLLQRVLTIRSQIKSKEITTEQSFTQYTQVIDSLLNMLLAFKHKTFVGVNTSKTTYPDLSAYVNLIEAIEYAGKLRAKTGKLLNFSNTKGAQLTPTIFYLNANLNSSLSDIHASKKVNDALVAIENSQERLQLNTLINALRANNQANMSAATWWEVSTRYIDMLTLVSKTIVADGQSFAQEYVRTTNIKSQLMIATFVAVACVSCFLFYAIWQLAKPKGVNKHAAVSYWQLSLVLFSILLVMLLAHKVSQRELEGQLKLQLTSELKNNAVHTLKSAEAIWYEPAKSELMAIQKALFPLTQIQIEAQPILSKYISNANVAIYDIQNKAWLINENNQLKTALEQIKGQYKAVEQGKILLTTVYRNNKLSAHFVTQLVSQQGVLPYQIWYSLTDLSPLISILKSPFLESDSNIIYFDNRNIVTNKGIYKNLKKAASKSHSNTIEPLLSPQTPRQYKNYLDKEVIGVLVWNNELHIGVGAEHELASVDAIVQNVQQEFSIQLFILLSLGGAILLFTYKIQNSAFSQLKHSEQQLEKDKIQLNNAQKIANMGSWEWSLGQLHIHISKELSNMLNLPREASQYSARSILRFIEPESRHQLIKAIKGYKILKSITLQLTTQNLPNITHVDLVANWQASEHDEHGPLEKTLVGIVKNVTLLVMEQNRQQRQQAALRAAREAALAKMEEADQQRHALEVALKENKETERLLQQTLDSIPAFILLLDSQARVTLVNQYWFKTQHADQFSGGLFLNTFFNVGDDCIDAINTLPLTKNKPLINALREAKFQDSYLAELECEYVITDGPIWFEVIITTLETHNGKSILMYQHDITQRKQDAMQLEEAKAKAELANDAKSRFLATMSHEIRTPMNGVVGMLDLLNQSNLSAEQSHLTSVAKNSSLMLLGIINDILDFSKIEAGKMVIDKVPFNWHNVIKEIAELLAHQVKEKHLQMYFLFDPELGYWQIGDPIRIRQILLNLIGNAIKFTKTSSSKIGLIEVSISSAKHDQHQLEISVSDNGKGITEKQQTLLFKPFTQADDSIQREYGGTGLGLSITQKLVTMMQGSIDCRSTENIGSTFKITLPCAKTTHKQAEIEIIFKDVSVCILGDEDIFESDLEANLTAHGAKCSIINWVNVSDNNIHALNVNYVIVTLERYQQIITANYQFQLDNKKTSYIILVNNNFTIPLPKESCCEAIYFNPYYSFKIIEHIAIREGIISPEILPTQLISNDHPLPTIEQAQQQNQLILVVEDNTYNQEVFKRQLSILGYQCMIAEHGEMALDFLASHSFALVITDCHMPIMDGYTFTKKYREREHLSSAQKELPIIAATANALSGERNKCIACGMNDYISKPIELNNLKNLLQKWMPSAISSNNTAKPENKTNQDNKNVLDLSQLATYVGDDTKIQHLFLKNFIADSTPLMSALQKRAKDFELVKSSAHQLKSSAKAIGANELANLYLEIEQAAKAQHSDKILDMLPSCVSIFNEVCSEITSILDLNE